MHERKEALKDGEFLVIGDFAENFSFVVQDEAQSFHWNNSSVTIHPFVYYFKENNQLENGNYALISNCNTHDTVAVYVFQKHLMQHLHEKFARVSKVIYFSDGCAGQYKNLKNCLTLFLHQYDFGMPEELHFLLQAMANVPMTVFEAPLSEKQTTRASLMRLYKDKILTPECVI